uniref:Uncharacterized protein LOC111099767 isoform X2 n=1 Tax=Crassostrea virginica TaxID=6565 RepID=A0A8B8A8H9_CRAVI|nr:uncharacterized protein LOC111099767 isoform X2 [Crassostrea virginica]
MASLKNFLLSSLVMETILIDWIVGDGLNFLPWRTDRPNSTPKTLKESTDKDPPFITTENARTELIENGTFHENHLSTSATKNGPYKVAIYLPIAVIIIVVIIVAAVIGLRVRKSRTKKTQIPSDEEMQLQGDDNST